MNIQDLGAIGEIVGGIAVLATLIYLAMQVRQSNVATHRNMYAQAAVSISEYWLALARDPELYEAFSEMLRNPEALIKGDLDRGYLVMDSYLSLMESYFLHNREYGEQESQKRWARIISGMLNTPGGRQYWSRRRAYFHDKFALYIDTLVESDG